MKSEIQAINKWVFFGWNYSLTDYEWTSVNGERKREVVPQFLAEVKWTCNFDHMLSKWHIATQDGKADSYLVKFYAELGTENRHMLLEWVLANYNDEQKIIDADGVDECPEAQTLAKIREWAEHYPCWLSNREGYARGYREGMMRAHKIVMSMITGEPLED